MCCDAPLFGVQGHGLLSSEVPQGELALFVGGISWPGEGECEYGDGAARWPLCAEKLAQFPALPEREWPCPWPEAVADDDDGLSVVSMPKGEALPPAERSVLSVIPASVPLNEWRGLVLDELPLSIRP